MPNSKAKQRKQKRQKWKTEGRTALQHKRWKAKQTKNNTPVYGRR